MTTSWEHRTCAQCGQTFNARRRPDRAQRFCTAACYHAYGREIRKESVDGRMRLVPNEHPLSTSHNARVPVARIVLYEKIGGGPHACHWCGQLVNWRPGFGPSKGSLVADHLNFDRTNDSPENLVPSCPVCNSMRTKEKNRSLVRDNEDFVVVSTKKGQVRTRAIRRKCEFCEAEFLAIPAHVRAGKARFCSRSCARKHPWRQGH